MKKLGLLPGRVHQPLEVLWNIRTRNDGPLRKKRDIGDQQAKISLTELVGILPGLR
ncbi:unnamed protein product [Musa banksii]